MIKILISFIVFVGVIVFLSKIKSYVEKRMYKRTESNLKRGLRDHERIIRKRIKSKLP